MLCDYVGLAEGEGGVCTCFLGTRLGGVWTRVIRCVLHFLGGGKALRLLRCGVLDMGDGLGDATTFPVIGNLSEFSFLTTLQRLRK
jgi:hypothetical protein